jgi:hypothetical protein
MRESCENYYDSKIIIKFDKSDILKLKEFVLNHQRPKLSSDFIDFIAIKLKEEGVKCWLTYSSNYILKACKSNKKSFLS